MSRCGLLLVGLTLVSFQHSALADAPDPDAPDPDAPDPDAPDPDEDRKKLMVGGQLMVTAEPVDGGGYDVGLNAFPLVVEYAVTGRIGVRLNTILNVQVAGDETGLAHQGGGLTIPVYLERSIVDDTWYAGPFVNVAYNPLVEGTDLTMAGELGLRWRFGSSWSFNLVAQVGATRFFRPEGDSWTSHIGFYPGVGRWF